MKTSPLRILHIGNEKYWRGGENQIRLLIDSNLCPEMTHFVAYPRKTKGYEYFSKRVTTLALASRSPYDPRNIFKLILFCRRHQIDIIDAQSSGGMSLGLWIKRVLPHIKLIVHRRVDNPIQQNWSSRRKYLSTLVDKYIVVSHAIRKILLQYGVKANQIELVHDAVDERPYSNLDREEARLKWHRRFPQAPTHAVWIGNASALSPQKAHDVLLNACADLKKRQLPFFCLIAGEGNLRGRLLKQWEHLQLASNVAFVGYIENVPEFLSALDVLVLPSNNEGLGSVLLEAAQARLALVGSDVGGIPEVIQHQQTGLLTPVSDSLSVTNAVESLIRDPQLRRKLADAAFSHVSKNFSRQAMVTATQGVYQAVATARLT